MSQRLKGWVEAPLGSLLDRIEAGASFKCDERPPGVGETGIVKVSAVTWGTFDEEESKTVRDVNRIDESLLIAPGDFLFSRANTINLVGACVVVGEVRRRLMLSDKILRFRTSGIEPRYLMHFLRSPVGRAEIESLATGNQESMRNISQDRIRAIRVPIAPLAEQLRIIAALEEHLSDLDAAVAGLERAKGNIERFREALRDAAATGRLEENGTAAGYSGDGGPPAGWRWTTVGECAASDPNAITDGPFGSKLKTEHYVESGPRVIRLQNIGRGRFVDARAHIAAEHFGTLQKHRVHAGDVVIAALGEPLPRACVIPQGVGLAIVKADCIRFKPDSTRLLGAFANLTLNAESTRRRVTAAIHGVGRPRLNLGEVREIRFLLPPLETQQRIVELVESRFAVADRTAAEIDVQIARAARLRRAILQRAFEGKLIPLTNDEPASALRTCIRDTRTTTGATVTPRGRGETRLPARRGNT